MNWNNSLKKKKQTTTGNDDREAFAFRHRTKKHYLNQLKEQEADEEIKDLNDSNKVQESIR